MGVDVVDLMAEGPMLADDSAGILGYILAELEGTQWGHDVAEAAAAYGARGAHDVEKVKGNNQHLEVEFQEAGMVAVAGDSPSQEEGADQTLDSTFDHKV